MTHRLQVQPAYLAGAMLCVPATYWKPLAQLEQEWRQRLESIESRNTSCHAVVNAALPPA